jgi:hypothetical protein
MNISFDLDSTLIPNGNEFETEKRNMLAKLLGIEKIRLGTYTIIKELQNKEHKVHIYTTSFRSKIRIRLTLLLYGIKISRIVNQNENYKILKKKNINASKYPSAFGFDLHIDDSKGVEIESKNFNFDVIIVEPSDEYWIDKIRKEISKIKKA